MSSLGVLPNLPRLSQESTLGISAALAISFPAARVYFPNMPLSVPVLTPAAYYYGRPKVRRTSSTNPRSGSPKKCHSWPFFYTNPRSAIIHIRNIATNPQRACTAAVGGYVRASGFGFSVVSSTACERLWDVCVANAPIPDSPSNPSAKGHSKLRLISHHKVANDKSTYLQLLAFQFRCTRISINIFDVSFFLMKLWKFSKVSKTCSKDEKRTLYVHVILARIMTHLDTVLIPATAFGS